jgi:hypothetical protein
VTTLAAYLDATDVTTAVGNLLGLRPYLGADASEDSHLVGWYSVAIDWCNTKLSRRDFTTADGYAGDNPPDTVVLGTYEFVRILREYASRANVLSTETKTGARSEKFDVPGMAGRMSAAAIAAWPYLEPHCEDPTLFASGGS